MMTVHGDDFTVVAPTEDLKWFEGKMKQKFELKVDYLGPDEGKSKELRVLNRVLRWSRGGIEYEPDQRHAEMIIEEMGMIGAKPVNTPTVHEDKEEAEAREEADELQPHEAIKY